MSSWASSKADPVTTFLTGRRPSERWDEESISVGRGDSSFPVDQLVRALGAPGMNSDRVSIDEVARRAGVAPESIRRSAEVAERLDVVRVDRSVNPCVLTLTQLGEKALAFGVA